jgi:hypothetical protein
VCNVPVFLALFLGDSHSLSRGFIDVIFGFDVHLETHDAERFQRLVAALLDALETALGTARHGRRRQVETERRAATLLRARKPQPLKIMKMERKKKKQVSFFFLIGVELHNNNTQNKREEMKSRS